jgi:hypothetical protein
MTLRTVDDVLDRLRSISRETRAPDGVRTFNRVYLTVTERVAEGFGTPASGTRGRYRDEAFMAQLDVDFATLWIDAYDAAKGGRRVPPAWAPLFEDRRNRSLLPIQFALAGMNSHIEHDLPLAVVTTCASRGTSPGRAAVRADYAAVNAVLAGVEAEIRRTFLTEVERLADEHIGPLVHLVGSWSIEKARDLAWVNVEALWSMRRLPPLAERFSAALAHTVGMASRYLLTPVT